MNQSEMNLIKAITDMTMQLGELKGKVSAVEDENKFLRELLKERLNVEEVK